MILCAKRHIQEQSILFVISNISSAPLFVFWYSFHFMVIVASVIDKHMLALTFLGVPVASDFRVVFGSVFSWLQEKLLIFVFYYVRVGMTTFKVPYL